MLHKIKSLTSTINVIEAFFQIKVKLCEPALIFENQMVEGRWKDIWVEWSMLSKSANRISGP